ncbi:U32 family peptidase [bacterium]|nr:U32 family peptidase [bacterium]
MMGDIIVLSLKDYSFNNGYSFTVDEILKIKSQTNKPIFLTITPLFHDDEFRELIEKLEKLKSLDGFIFQDLGLVSIFQDLDIVSKVIYAPETFITNHIDKEYFMETGINKFLLSREITKEDITMILKYKKDTSYMYCAFGYQMLFYSYRNHLSFFKEKYNLDIDLKNKLNLSIKEETRDEHYKVIEDERGFRIYKDKILNAYTEAKELNIEYIILDRVFITDDMYFDAIKLFKGEISLDKFNDIYKNIPFEKAYLYKEIGLFKENES